MLQCLRRAFDARRMIAQGKASQCIRKLFVAQPAQRSSAQWVQRNISNIIRLYFCCVRLVRAPFAAKDRTCRLAFDVLSNADASNRTIVSTLDTPQVTTRHRTIRSLLLLSVCNMLLTLHVTLLQRLSARQFGPEFGFKARLLIRRRTLHIHTHAHGLRCAV